MESRVFVSGIGIVSPIGHDREEFTDALLQGKDGFRKITCFQTREGKDQAAIISKYPEVDQRRLLKMLSQGVKEAVIDAALPEGALKKTALIMATMAGDSRNAEEVWGGLARDRKINHRETMRSVIKYPMSSLLDALAVRFRIEGPRVVVSNACASGNIAIGYGLNLLENGDSDVVIVCGVEALKETMYWGMHGLRILAGELKAFDLERQGTVLGEGIGVLVLERAEQVFARNARYRGEIAGYGNSCDPHSDAIIPDEDGFGLALAMEKAIISAGIEWHQIDYINAYGTGTVVSDLTETRAIKRVFGERAGEIPISSSKTFLGNSGGASGILEAIVTLTAMEKGFIPPTLNWQSRDPELNLDYVPQHKRQGKITYALSNSIGGGGVNTSIVLKAADVAEQEFKAAKDGGVGRTEMISRSRESEEIVVTGMGIFSPLGNTVASFGICVRGLYEREEQNRNCQCSKDHLSSLNEKFRRANPAAKYLMLAADEAVDRARFTDFRSEQVGIVIGTAFGGYTSTAMELCDTLLKKGSNYITPYILTNHGHNLGATLLSQKYGISGYNITLTTGTTAGLDAVIHAARVLQKSDELTAILVGGVDILDPPVIAVSEYLQNHSGQKWIPGEGAGVLILEKKHSAMERGVKVYGTITGFEQGSFAIGRGNIRFDPDRLRLGLQKKWREIGSGTGIGPELFFCHLPYIHCFLDTMPETCRDFLRDVNQWAPVIDLTTFFGEAHAATGVLGFIAALTVNWGPDCGYGSKPADRVGLFGIAPGGNYTFVECCGNGGVG